MLASDLAAELQITHAQLDGCVYGNIVKIEPTDDLNEREVLCIRRTAEMRHPIRPAGWTPPTIYDLLMEDRKLNPVRDLFAEAGIQLEMEDTGGNNIVLVGLLNGGTFVVGPDHSVDGDQYTLALFPDDEWEHPSEPIHFHDLGTATTAGGVMDLYTSEREHPTA